MTKFKAVVQSFVKCRRCDDFQSGNYNRMDCGCVREVTVGEYKTANAARLAAMAKARRKGTTLQGRMNGIWSVETKDGIIESGDIRDISK